MLLSLFYIKLRVSLIHTISAIYNLPSYVNIFKQLIVHFVHLNGQSILTFLHSLIWNSTNQSALLCLDKVVQVNSTKHLQSLSVTWMTLLATQKKWCIIKTSCWVIWILFWWCKRYVHVSSIIENISAQYTYAWNENAKIPIVYLHIAMSLYNFMCVSYIYIRLLFLFVTAAMFQLLLGWCACVGKNAWWY